MEYNKFYLLENNEITPEECAETSFDISKYSLIADVMKCVTAFAETLTIDPVLINPDPTTYFGQSVLWNLDFIRKAMELLGFKEMREALNIQSLEYWIPLWNEYLDNLSVEEENKISEYL